MKCIWTIAIIIIPMLVISQKVENLRSELEGNKIIIEYDLLETQPDDYYNIIIKASVDGRRIKKIKGVDGDVGKYVQGGKSRKIYWYYSNDVNKIGSAEFYLKAKIKYRYKNIFFGANSTINTPIGVMAGYIRNWGGYLCFRFKPGTINIDNPSPQSDYGYTPTVFVAGVTKLISMNKTKRLYMNMGVGRGIWGEREVDVWDHENGYVTVRRPNNGTQLELGTIITIKRAVVLINFVQLFAPGGYGADISIGLGFTI